MVTVERASVGLGELLPYNLALFLGYSAIGIPLPVIAIHLQGRLHADPVTVGAVVGIQYLATLLTRRYAGGVCDRRGPKLATLAGLGVASLAGLLYLASALTLSSIPCSLGLMVLARIVLGIGESLFVTGSGAWGIAHVGARHTGKVMAWNGIAMYGALAIGAPIGTTLYQAGGFPVIAAAVILLPLAGVLVGARRPHAAPQPGRQMSFGRVIRFVWAPGLALALASSGVGTISAFLALRYQQAGWPGGGLALTAFGATYILMRLRFGGLPDRLGGRKVAIASLALESAGLALLWGAAEPVQAFVGAAVTGIGYSLVFPSLGVEAMRWIPPENRGLALGAFLACFDLGLGVAGPMAGAFASAFGLPSAFLAAAGAALISVTLLLTTAARKTCRLPHSLSLSM
jgi:MFS family permease